MQTILWLWLANGVLLFVTLYGAVCVLGALRREARKRRREWFFKSELLLAGRPEAVEIAAALQPVLPGPLPELLEAVVKLAEAPPRDMEHIREVCTRAVNATNRFAEPVDDQLGAAPLE